MNELRHRLNEIALLSFDRLNLDASKALFIPSQRPELSDFQCNAALAIAKEKQVNPISLAETISQALEQDFKSAGIELAIRVDPPGFINVKLADAFLAEVLKRFEPDVSVQTDEPETIIIDYGGPNIAKSLHIGHIRTSIVGESIKRILRALGHEVYGDIHWGDWGTHMGILIAYLEEKNPDWPYFNNGNCDGHSAQITLEDLNRIYPEGAARFKADTAFAERARKAIKALHNGHKGYRALWKQFVDVTVPSVKKDLSRLNVDFDLWCGESTVHDDIADMLNELRKQNLVRESDGALIFPVALPTDKHEIPPLILEKSGGDEDEVGGYTYATSDLATIRARMRDYSPTKILYVVDVRQSLHFTQLFRAAALAGYCKEDQLEFLGIGTINNKDGKPFKTRSGGVMRLTDLLDLAYEAAAKKSGIDPALPNHDPIVESISVAALKFQDLRINRTMNYTFDPEGAIQHEGKTGPYIQYAAARIQSILDKAKERFPACQQRNIILDTSEERVLCLKLLAYPDALAAAASWRSPSELCTYLYETAQIFSNFYQQCPVLSSDLPEEISASRLQIIAKTLNVIRACATLLGFDLPERMPSTAQVI